MREIIILFPAYAGSDKDSYAITKKNIILESPLTPPLAIPSKIVKTKTMSQIGTRFGRLTIIKESRHRQPSLRELLAECDCGKSIKLKSNFITLKIKDCGHCKEPNQKNCYLLTYRNKTKSLQRWSKELDLPYSYIISEYKRGSRGRQVFDNIRRKMRFTVAYGENLPLSRWAKRTPLLSFHYLRKQWNCGKRGESLFMVNGEEIRPMTKREYKQYLTRKRSGR